QTAPRTPAGCRRSEGSRRGDMSALYHESSGERARDVRRRVAARRPERSIGHVLSARPGSGGARRAAGTRGGPATRLAEAAGAGSAAVGGALGWFGGGGRGVSAAPRAPAAPEQPPAARPVRVDEPLSVQIPPSLDGRDQRVSPAIGGAPPRAEASPIDTASH